MALTYNGERYGLTGEQHNTGGGRSDGAIFTPEECVGHTSDPNAITDSPVCMSFCDNYCSTANSDTPQYSSMCMGPIDSCYGQMACSYCVETTASDESQWGSHKCICECAAWNQYGWWMPFFNSWGNQWDFSTSCSQDAGGGGLGPGSGDVDQNGVLTVNDIVMLVDMIMNSGVPNQLGQQFPEADLQCSSIYNMESQQFECVMGQLDVGDVAVLVNMIMADARISQSDKNRAEQLLARVNGMGSTNRQNIRQRRGVRKSMRKGGRLKPRRMAGGGRTRPKKYPHGGAFDGGYCTAPEGSPSAWFTDCSQLSHSDCAAEGNCIWLPPSSLPQSPQRLRPQTQRRMNSGGRTTVHNKHKKTPHGKKISSGTSGVRKLKKYGLSTNKCKSINSKYECHENNCHWNIQDGSCH